MGRRIRFAVQAPPIGDPAEFRELARKAEDLGFFALYVADHIGVTADPFATLAAAAAATSSLRLGTYVCNAGVRDPLAIATGAATVDVLSNGRMILGFGAGHTPAEWTMLARPYPSAGERVRRLVEVVDVVGALLRGEVVTYDGESVRTREAFLLGPRPVQDEIPFLVGGNGDAVMRLAGRAAEVAGLTGLGRTLADGHRHSADWSQAGIDSRVAIVRAAAATRPSPPVIDALVQHVRITEDRDAAAAIVASHVEGVDAAGVIAAPYVLVGTVDQIVEEIATHHERWGFTSYVVRADAIDAVARLIDALRIAEVL